ncbi:energy transducer TonB [Sphingorhabdus contaminans]|jgi:periplasmic protein TonB|uniref:Energy transducer TonB n=1 Tax=Sphingorhabdus contaminans TaxID=1343899 RepID=A0A553W9C7_9SPHN|nr:energy transducer TonB [Sphingorhabdus contaminans]TSB01293.1 energy transducer TonB [Sphingorhabdus contaminans]
MAYADQDGMSTNRLVSVIIVILLHAFLGYALVTGLAYDAVVAIKEKMTVVDVKEEEPPEEEEPPPEPEKQIEPPVVSPPPMVVTVTPPPTVRTVDTPPPAAPIVPTAAPPAPSAPPPPPPPVAKRPNPIPKGNPGNWANTNDYPSRALQQEREGTTGFRVTVGPNGRVTDCQITSSSGHADLDQATCSNVTRRARFDPALDGSGNPTTGTYSNRVRWQIPK